MSPPAHRLGTAWRWNILHPRLLFLVVFFAPSLQLFLRLQLTGTVFPLLFVHGKCAREAGAVTGVYPRSAGKEVIWPNP